MNKSTGEYSDKISHTAESIQNADCLLIGVGAGMSASGGLNYTDPALAQKWYPEYFEQGKRSIIEIMSLYWPTSINKENAAAYWGFWARHIYHIRYESEALPPYLNLFKIIKGKNYYICTTNVDCQLNKAGFSKDDIFAPQGNYGFFQCEKPCSQDVYDNENMIKRMLENFISPFEIRNERIPLCPKCGSHLMPNLRCDNRYVGEPHMINQDMYINFVNNAHEKKLVLLELGVGYNTPVIIRYPFEAITLKYPYATLVRINTSDAGVSESIAKKSICIQEDIGKVLSDLCGQMK
jgi:NAD-dependent SIR2 family protein deacetylase